jgi:hypothetical protein
MAGERSKSGSNKEVRPMSCCSELKLNQVWVCEECGLEVKIVKECDCLTEGAKACKVKECLICCDKPLKLKR